MTTLSEADPHPAELIYKTNPGNNDVSGQIGGSVIKELKDEVSQNIVKSYTQTVYGNYSIGFAAIMLIMHLLRAGKSAGPAAGTGTGTSAAAAN